MRTEIFNPFKSQGLNPYFYTVGEPIKQLGEYTVYTNSYNSEIIAYKGIAIAERVKVSKELLEQLHNNQPPQTKDHSFFSYQRCKEWEIKGREVYNKHFNK